MDAEKCDVDTIENNSSIQKPSKKHSIIKNEDFLKPPIENSLFEEANSNRMALYDRVKRPSLDSAVIEHLNVVKDPSDYTQPSQPKNQQRRMTLTVADIPLRPALLPLAEPTNLPESPVLLNQPNQDWNPNHGPVVVQSKMILESKIVELPPTNPPGDITEINVLGADTANMSRRESTHSDIDIYDFNMADRKRFVRTPSVVVSDYSLSDDILCGITLEELKFFRNQRKASLGVINREPCDTTFPNQIMNKSSLTDSIPSCSNLSFAESDNSFSDDGYLVASNAPSSSSINNLSFADDNY